MNKSAERVLKALEPEVEELLKARPLEALQAIVSNYVGLVNALLGTWVDDREREATDFRGT